MFVFERERASELAVCHFTFLCTWLLPVCARTGGGPCNLGIWGRHCNQPSNPARAVSVVLSPLPPVYGTFLQAPLPGDQSQPKPLDLPGLPSPSCATSSPRSRLSCVCSSAHSVPGTRLTSGPRWPLPCCRVLLEWPLRTPLSAETTLSLQVGSLPAPLRSEPPESVPAFDAS